MKRPIFFAVFGVLISILPIFIRIFFDQPILPGIDSYVFASYIENIGFSRTFSSVSLITLNALMLGIGTFFAYYALKRLRMAQSRIDATLALVILSPAFIAGAVLIPAHAFHMVILSASFYFLQARKKLEWRIGAVLLAIAGITIIWDSLTGSFGFSITNSVVELGAARGYSIFGLIAAIVGGSVLWKNKAKYYSITIGILILVISSFAVPALTMPGSMAVAVAGGLGFVRLQTRKWTFQLIRMLSLILFICGILFSTVTFATFEIRASPNKELATGLSELRYQLPDGQVVSSPVNSVWITYWSGRQNAELSASQYDTLWYSRNLVNTTEIFVIEGIEGVIITSDMRSDIWKGDDEGLLFILQNSKAFKRIGRSDMIQSWAFIPRELNLSDQ